MSRQPSILRRSGLLRGDTESRARPTAERIGGALARAGWCPVLSPPVRALFSSNERGTASRSQLVTLLSADRALAQIVMQRLGEQAATPGRAPRSLDAAVRLTRFADLCVAALDGALSQGLLSPCLLRHSRRVGDAAAFLATEIGLPEHHARAAGLLHDVGRVGLPLAAAQVEGLVLTRALVAQHHATAAAAMVRAWGLPDALQDAVGPRPTRLGLLVQVAEALVLDSGFGHADDRVPRGVTWDLPSHVSGLASRAGLDPARLRAWRDRLRHV
ncbi:MAG: HDIG domain-containing metalloprotein [Myxococcota bacterium]|nr:HDIG domain-containing metalloprotein [Myxococcota bacterium]